MSSKLKGFIIFIITFIAAYIIAPYSGRLYEIIIGHRIPGAWIGGCPECYEGFLLTFSFFAGLLFFGFCSTKSRLNLSVVFILIPALLLLFARLGEAFLLAIGFGIVGLLFGQIIYWLRSKYCSSAKQKPAKSKTSTK